MGVKEKKDAPVRPLPLTFGVALAVSLGGILYTIFRGRRMNPLNSKSSQNSPGSSSQAELRSDCGELTDNDHDLQDSVPTKSPQSSRNDLSSDRCNGDRDGFLLPEFNEFLRECDVGVTSDDISREALVPEAESPREYKCSEHEEYDKEIRSLRSKVEILEERERILEFQLLEYYGLEEHEAAVMELQNRLTVNDMNAKLYSLKIESLQSDNRMLEAQVADYAKVVAELEAAKAKIKLLKKKLKVEAEQNREHIWTLQERVKKLLDQEKKAVEVDHNVDKQLQKMKEMEDELEDMKKTNDTLKLENCDLSKKLEQLQILATSTMDDKEIQELKEEVQLLRQQNEDLKKEIDRIQADWCTDIEELVYLRWINACLRYEMRNHQPGPGKTIARDLNKKLSPESEEKAKELILEYANTECSVGMSISDFGSDQLSTSLASCLGEPHSPINPLSAKKANHSSKVKSFAKLLPWRRKDGHQDFQTSPSSLERATSLQDFLNRYYSNSHSCIVSAGADGITNTSNTSRGDLSRHSFDLQRSYSLEQKSTPGESSTSSQGTGDDISLMSILRRFDLQQQYDYESPKTVQAHQDVQNAAKIKLVKYANALKNSRAKSSFRQRSISFG